MPHFIRFSSLALMFMLALAFAGSARADDAKPAPFKVVVEGKGPPMILIPGLANSGEVWDTTVAHFKDKYECHVLTLGGFAGAPKVAGPFLETMRKGIVDYVREKKLEKPVIVGHSLGGYMAFLLASSEPDLFGPIVAVDGVPCSAALFGNGEVTPDQLKQGAMIGAFITATPRDQFLARQRQFVGMWLSDVAQLDRVLKWCEASDQSTVGNAMGELLSSDLRKKIAAITSPALLVGALGMSANDEERAVARKKYEQQIAKAPHGKVVFAEKAKHYVMIDAPDWLWGEMEKFLGEAPARK